MFATRFALASVLVLASAFCSRPLGAQEREVDTAHSTIKLRVLKSGVFSAFGHNHEIEAHIADGRVHLGDNPSVAITVRARDLKVADPDASPKDRQEIQQTMEGPKVLDVERFAEISFKSTEIRMQGGKEKSEKGEQRWNVRGNLTLHGKSSPITMVVESRHDHYVGTCEVRQRDFGMTPVSVAGGSVKVKDEVKVEFDVVLK